MRVSGPIACIALYAALYTAFGVASPFWPKYFETRALIPEQIGLILASALLVRLVAGPLVGVLALWSRERAKAFFCAMGLRVAHPADVGSDAVRSLGRANRIQKS
jgi:PPP family 3-phenylpropionic acid transporter